MHIGEFGGMFSAIYIYIIVGMVPQLKHMCNISNDWNVWGKDTWNQTYVFCFCFFQSEEDCMHVSHFVCT